jgi:diaminohydroxyphosphoribosylaminopyrimidine deaminase/5-amino-6-(5-phosphoribosylamino)uracil reductase
MQRCLQLAIKGNATVAPNPMVGAVLVHNDQIIGEGWHQTYGKAHAEVNCINSVLNKNIKLIKDAVLYISLEPCNHIGKTPACTQFIIAHNIKKVIIGCIDYNTKVKGSGILFLQKNGVEVVQNVLQKECINLNAPFFNTTNNNLPSITLKWAQSKDGFINSSVSEQTNISNVYTNRFVHKLRAIHQAIMVGSNTVKIDNPLLTNRYFGTKQPIKIVVDRFLQIDWENNPLSKSGNLIVLNCTKNEQIGAVNYLYAFNNDFFLLESLKNLYKLGIATILVEGGAALLQLFIENNYYNKAIRITNETLILKNGICAPQSFSYSGRNTFTLANDTVEFFSQ